MFLLRNKIFANFVRHRRDIFNTQSSRKDSSPKAEESSVNHPKSEQSYEYIPPSSLFPYKFGGVSTYPKQISQLEMLLPENGKSTFSRKYLRLLEAIQNKDSQILQNLIQPSMVNPLLNKDVKTVLRNKDSKGKIQFNSFRIVIGARFDRKNDDKLQKMGSGDQQIGLFMPQNFNPAGMSIGSGLPIIINIRTTFLSKAILMPQNSRQSSKEEAHIIDFEYERHIKPTDMMGMMAKMSIKSIDRETFHNFLVKDNQSWKIANIDDFLKSRFE